MLHCPCTGLGGALMFEQVQGKVDVNAQFIGNLASDGGAMHVVRAHPGSVMNINGYYEKNEAHDFGWGSRGGALRIQNVEGTVNIDGTYIGNSAPINRGGVIAVNRFYAGGNMYVKGTYRDNFAGTTGGMLDGCDAQAWCVMSC